MRTKKKNKLRVCLENLATVFFLNQTALQKLQQSFIQIFTINILSQQTSQQVHIFQDDTKARLHG